MLGFIVQSAAHWTADSGVESSNPSQVISWNTVLSPARNPREGVMQYDKIDFMVILSFPLIQEGQLSVIVKEY